MKRILFLLLLLGCTSASVPREPVHIVIVGTTDVHGRFDVQTADEIPSGGLALLASYVSALRKANGGRVVVVDSGDVFQGTLESNLFEGEPIVHAYNAIGYHAVAVGNHEFDYGPAGPAAIPKSPSDDPLGALKRNAALARFKFLSANMVEKSTGKTPAWALPSALLDVAGIRLGVIGLTTPDTPNVTMKQNVTTLEFTDPVAATIREAQALRQRGADAVIAIAHIGGRCTDQRDPADTSSCEPDSHSIQLLRALPAGTIDAFFGGHTHSYTRHVVSGVPMLQSGAYSRSFAALDLWVDPNENRVVRSSLREHTNLCSEVWAGTDSCDSRRKPAGGTRAPRIYEGQTISRDAAVDAILRPYLQKVEEKKNEPTGIRTSARMPRRYQEESVLGNVLTDALRSAMKTDIAVLNSGGIRDHLRAGELRYRDIFEVLPFDNYPTVIRLTGAEIEEMLQVTTSGSRGVLQVSGLKYTYDASKDAGLPEEKRRRLVSVTLPDGRPLQPDAMYTVATVDFVAAGGEGLGPLFGRLPADRFEWRYDLPPLRDVVIPVLRAMPQPLEPRIEGRITALNHTEQER
ncbi:MAG TPA: 5'-nucleotidase C-terminal domain-containing protein [Thermoanaerobaculia bacterium]|nr:5'-nucleotidase C-terminal domain-containing protein [Thermoanaerobaculia bacterium]